MPFRSLNYEWLLHYRLPHAWGACRLLPGALSGPGLVLNSVLLCGLCALQPCLSGQLQHRDIHPHAGTDADQVGEAQHTAEDGPGGPEGPGGRQAEEQQRDQQRWDPQGMPHLQKASQELRDLPVDLEHAAVGLVFGVLTVAVVGC